MTEGDLARTEGRKAKGYAKVDRLTADARVKFVLDMVLRGYTVNAVFRLVSGDMTDKPAGPEYEPPGGVWDVSYRMVQNYAIRARKILADEAALTRAESIITTRRRYELILSKALAAGNLTTAERAVRSIARLDGLEAPKMVTVAGNVAHEHSGEVVHTHRANTIEERADGVRKLYAIAAERQKRAVLTPTTAASA